MSRTPDARLQTPDKKHTPDSRCQTINVDHNKGYRRLVAWQKAKILALSIYKASATFPKSEIYCLTSQLRRAAISVPANIAEGQERQYDKEHVQFFFIALGSLAEVEVYLDLSLELDYLDSTIVSQLIDQTTEVGRLTNGLIKSLKTNYMVKETPESGVWSLESNHVG